MDLREGMFLPEAPQQLRGSSILRELETHPRKGATPGPYLGSNRNIPGYPGSNEYIRNKLRKASPSITRMREIHAVITLSRQARAGIVTPVLPIHRTTGGRDSGVTWRIGRLLAMVTTGRSLLTLISRAILKQWVQWSRSWLYRHGWRGVVSCSHFGSRKVPRE